MPKRTRGDEVKRATVSRPVSAVAARRRQQETPPEPATETAPTPPPKARNPGPEKAKDTSSSDDNAIRRKRPGTEKKLTERVTAVEGPHSSGTASTPKAAAKTSSPDPNHEESALARTRKRRGEELKVSAAVTDEDIAMRSVGESDDDAAEFADVVPEKTVYAVSSFVPREENYSMGDASMTFLLQPGETLALVGIYQLKVTKGAIQVAGANLAEDSAAEIIYAPMTHALPLIEVPSSKHRKSDNQFAVELQVTNHHSELPNLCSAFSTIWKASSSEKRSYTFSPIFTAATAIPTLTIPLPWKSALASLIKKSSAASPPVILISGSKNTGKSTFARILTNRLLTSNVENVAYLDVDPGQPEFSPPGIISLNLLLTPILGPPFSHANLATALKAHHIGYVSPREDPSHYINCIADLLSHYRSTFPTLPLIINSAGWTKGLGLELFQEILIYAQPSEIVFLGSSTPREIAPTGATTTLYELPATRTTPAQPPYTPADLRTLQTMSYFHRQTTDWDCSSPLTGFAPWVVPYRSPAGVVAIHILGGGGGGIDPGELAAAVEGTIVAVVLVHEHHLPESLPSVAAATATAGTLPPLLQDPLHPSVSQCAGLAVLRAIDTDNLDVHLLTPIPADKIATWDKDDKRVVLVRGRLELPAWEMLMPTGEKNDIPWLSYGTGKKAGGGLWRVRRNVMRRFGTSA